MRGLLLALWWDATTAVVDETRRIVRSAARRLGDWERAPFTTEIRSTRTLGTVERIATIVLRANSIVRVGGATTRERISAVSQLRAAHVLDLIATSAVRVIGDVTAEARSLADARRDPYATAQTRAHAVNVITRKVVIVNG